MNTDTQRSHAPDEDDSTPGEGVAAMKPVDGHNPQQ